MLRANNYKDFKYILRYYFFKILPKCLYPVCLQYKYKKLYNQNLNLRHPLKLSEKLQLLKLYDKNPQKTLLSDKLAAKDYIKNNIPELKTAKVYGIYNNFKEINFSRLPEKFVLKTNHAWKTNIYCSKKELTEEKIKSLAEYYKSALKINYAYWSYYELQYKNIKPKIFVEEFLYNNDSIKLIEYEVYCFNGKPEFIKIAYTVKNISCDFYKMYYYDTNYKKTDFALDFVCTNKEEKKLDNFNKVTEYAAKLSQGFNFVRVDFVEAKNELYFAEMTFSPFSGFIKFIPDKYDYIYGRKLHLDNNLESNLFM